MKTEKKKFVIRLFNCLIVLFPFSSASAFVENVTHGYVNCTSCHVSPTGGGLLTSYGRSLSRELMSTWGWENSEAPLFGALNLPESVKLGGDFRTIQTRFENSQIKQGQQFEMQKNLELGLILGQVQFVGTLGRQEGPDATPGKGEFLSERHYLLWDLTEEIKLRAGKFRLAFGLNDPNHTRVTKQAIGFGSNSESYILELAKFSDEGELFISADLGQLDIPGNQILEKSISATYSRYLTDESKAGISYLLGENASRRRSLLGIHGVSSLTKKLLIKFESAFQQTFAIANPQEITSATKTELLALVATLGYEATKGVLPYLVAEQLQSDLTDRLSQRSSLGVGIQWLPLPHFELQAEYKKQDNKVDPEPKSDSGWLIFHFYL